MLYPNIRRAEFLSRPNRFIANVLLEDGTKETVHVKNTGRCRELLVPGCTVFLCRSDNPSRKTKYDLIATEKRCADGSVLLVNMDSQIPNDVAAEWLPHSGIFSGNAVFHREYTHGNSRFDFMVQESGMQSFVEVKGCTLENEGICSFPDAPTERGVKHVRELITAVQEGYGAYLLFIVQMKGMRYLVPNDATHQAFGEAVREAQKAGVKILAVECDITPQSIVALRPIPVVL